MTSYITEKGQDLLKNIAKLVRSKAKQIFQLDSTCLGEWMLQLFI